MNPQKLTKALQSRGAAIFASLLLAGSSLWAFSSGVTAPLTQNEGIALPSPNLWISDPVASLCCVLALNIGVGVLMVVANGMYNFIRSLSIGYASLFLVMQTAVPDDTVQLNGAAMMLLVSVLCMIILFSCYSNPAETRRIFLIFFLLSSGAACHYGFLFLIPVFFLGMIQMRVMKVRPVLAALIGLATPWWMLFGFGIVRPESLSWPEFTGIFQAFDSGEAAHLVALAGVSAFLALAAWGLNFTKLIAYNAKTRAMNGFVTLSAIASILMMVTDYSNFPAYISLLNCYTAYLAGHYIAIRQTEKG